MRRPFVPDPFEPPLTFRGDGFRLEPLGPQHNERDHEAWMSSIEWIRSTPGFPHGDWPKPMSLESNLADLVRHARDFTEGKGFTYSILDGDDVIGCLYIYPSDIEANDAVVRSWVTESRSEMDVIVYRDVSEWIGRSWPFESPHYAQRPGE